MNVLTDGGKEFGQYPLAVYGKAILTFCTVVVPYAWFQQIPLDYLTGNSGNILRMFAPLVCFVFIIPCYAIWRFGLRNYRLVPERPIQTQEPSAPGEKFRPAFCFGVDRFHWIKYYKLYKLYFYY